MFCILGFWVRFPLKQASVAANLLESQWARRLGKPFSRADILFLPSHEPWILVKNGKIPCAQDSRPLPAVGTELLEAEAVDMGGVKI